MKTYRLVVRPNIRLAAHGLMSPLTEDALILAIPDIAVRELSEAHFGGHVVDVALRRPDDAKALSEIVEALERLGFSFVEAIVSEWASGMAVKAMGAAGGFVVGAGISENLVVGLAASAVGTFIGHFVGDATRQVVRDYRTHRDHRGVWVFEEMIPRQQSASADRRLGISPA